MSEYEGKVHRPKRRNVDLIDLLYYEASGGQFLSSEDREKFGFKLKLAEKSHKIIRDTK